MQKCIPFKLVSAEFRVPEFLWERNLVDLFEQPVGANEDSVQEVEAQVQRLEKDMSYVMDRVDDFEIWSHHSNLRFVGVQESSEGDDAIGFMSRLIQQLLEQDNFPTPPIIEWATTVRLSDKATEPVPGL